MTAEATAIGTKARSARPSTSAAADRSYPWRRDLAIVVLALVARLLYWRFAIPHYKPVSDASQYAEIAHNLLHGHGFSMRYPQFGRHPTAFRPPVYPLVLAAWWRVFGESVGAGQVLGLVTGSATVLLVERLGRRIAGPLAGVVAAIAVAVYIPLIAADPVLLTESLSAVLLLSALLLLLDHRYAWAGLATGLLVLTRPSAQGFVVVIVLWALVTAGWRPALRFGAVAVLVVVPWVIRNQVQLGAPVMYTSNGFNLAAVYADASYRHGFVDPIFSSDFRDIRHTQVDEVQWDKALRKSAATGLRHHPLEPLHVMKLNAQSWFETQPRHNDLATLIDGRNISVDHWTLTEFYLFTLLGVAGLVLHRNRRATALLGAVAVYVTIASLLFIAVPRLRAPFDLICCIGIGLLAARKWGTGATEAPTE